MVERKKLPDPEEQPTMSVHPETSGALGVSRETAYAMVRDGVVPSIRAGSRILVPTALLRRKLGLDV